MRRRASPHRARVASTDPWRVAKSRVSVVKHAASAAPASTKPIRAIAIRFGNGPWPPLVCEKFLDDEYFLVASPTLYRGKLPRTPEELLEARIIREERDLWEAWFKAAGVEFDAPMQGPSFNDSTFALQAAARGEGIALARRSILGEDLERGTLKRLFDISLPSPTCYWFVSPKETAAMAKVKLFRDWVRAELAAGPTRGLIQPRPKGVFRPLGGDPSTGFNR